MPYTNLGCGLYPAFGSLLQFYYIEMDPKLDKLFLSFEAQLSQFFLAFNQAQAQPIHAMGSHPNRALTFSGPNAVIGHVLAERSVKID